MRHSMSLDSSATVVYGANAFELARVLIAKQPVLRPFNILKKQENQENQENQVVIEDGMWFLGDWLFFWNLTTCFFRSVP